MIISFNVTPIFIKIKQFSGNSCAICYVLYIVICCDTVDIDDYNII